MTATLELIRRDAQVAEIWLNRPDVRNAFNDRLIAELAQAFQTIAADPQVRAVVLGGRGKAFCAGADLTWMRAMAEFDWERNRADAQALADMLYTVWRCPVPVIARVHGDCYAGAVGLVAACDIVVAAEAAGFCLSEVRLGLLPATISPYVIRAMGERAARRYTLTAERFDGVRAHEMGFVQDVCAVEEIDDKVNEILGLVLANGPQAVRACKRLITDVAGAPLDDRLRAETARRIADVRASDEGKEGVAAFLGKRAANWLGSP